MFDGRGRYPQSHQRKWLRVGAGGDLSYIAADKHTFVSTLAIPLRDLRMIDPMVRLCSVHCQGIHLLMLPSFFKRDLQQFAQRTTPGLSSSYIAAGGSELPDSNICQGEGNRDQPGETQADHKQG